MNKKDLKKLDKILDGTGYSSTHKGLRTYFGVTSKVLPDFIKSVTKAGVPEADIKAVAIYLLNCKWNGVVSIGPYHSVYNSELFAKILRTPEMIKVLYDKHIRTGTILNYNRAIERIDHYYRAVDRINASRKEVI